MLAYFLAKLHRVDPDIIVGHNMGSFALEVLQHRMAACKVPQWSRIGRLRRKELPKVHTSQLLYVYISGIQHIASQIGQCIGTPLCCVFVHVHTIIFNLLVDANVRDN